MKDYAKSLNGKLSQSSSSTHWYEFNLSVLNAVKSDMAEVLREVQEATSINNDVEHLLEQMGSNTMVEIA